ncbi:hypothetical protein ACFLYD_04270 [Chloroflexota bacterium]
MLELAPDARDASIMAIICNGNCPGVIDLMQMHADDQLDEIER